MGRRRDNYQIQQVWSTDLHKGKNDDHSVLLVSCGPSETALTSDNYNDDVVSNSSCISKRSESPKDGGQEMEELPVKQRQCRDVVFLLIISAFVLVLVGLIIYAGTQSDIKRFIHGSDKYGNICGRKNKKIQGSDQSGKDMTNLTYSEPSDMFSGQIYSKCVATCNSTQFKTLLHRCVPNVVKEMSRRIGEIVSKIANSDFFKEATDDIEACWLEIVYLCLIALAIALILTLSLRFFTTVVVYLTVFLAIVGSLGVTGYLWYRYYDIRTYVDGLGDKATPDMKRSVTNWMIYGIVATISTAFLLFILFVMRKRIRLVIALFIEASKAISNMPCLLFQPIWTFLALLIVCTLWIGGIILIESAGTPSANSTTGLVTYSKDMVVQVTRWYHVVALIWLSQFCLACQDIIIAGAVTKWFFTRNKSELGCPIFASLGNLIRYYLGCVALGSLIMAIIKIIRLLFRTLERKLEQSSTACLKFCLVCVQCCLGCCEGLLLHITRNAYVVISIHGYSFCAAARRSFQVIRGNALRMVAINSVGDLVLFLCKIIVVVSVVLIGMEMIKAKGNVSHVWVPISIAVIFSFFIAHCFLSVFEMTVDSIMVCFCEDCYMNDGVTRPYYMNKSLMELIEGSKRELDKIKNGSKIGPEPEGNSSD